jgi:hypothetical protein
MIRNGLAVVAFVLLVSDARAICPYDANCLDNPYGGRGDASGNLTAPYSPFGQYSPNGTSSAFGNNPLTRQPPNNPYLPSVSSDENQAAPRGALNKPSGALQGIDPDRQPLGGALQGVDPDQQR